MSKKEYGSLLYLVMIHSYCFDEVKRGAFKKSINFRPTLPVFWTFQPKSYFFDTEICLCNGFLTLFVIDSLCIALSVQNKAGFPVSGNLIAPCKLCELLSYSLADFSCLFIYPHFVLEDFKNYCGLYGISGKCIIDCYI